MLHLILGRAGSGKSHTVRDLLAQRAKQGQRDMILLVPEQFSFESERALLHRLGVSPAGQIEVLSFSRLAARVFQQAGGIAGKALDDAGRVVLMTMAVDAVKDRLSVYQRAASSSDFVGEMLGAVKEWKLCAITPRQLSDAARSLEEGILQRKLNDFSLLYGAYNALLEGSYADPDDDLTRLHDKLMEYPFFAGKTVAVDSFKGFTGQQMKIMEDIIATAKDTYVTLCCDSLQDRQEGMGLFSNVISCANRLLGIADRHGVGIASPRVLDSQPRFQTPSLAVLEQNLFSLERDTYDENSPEVTIVSAQTRYDEAEYAARAIRRLVREEGMRYREIAVIARKEEDYAGIVEGAFARYGIPCFLDRRVPVTYLPLMRLVLSALSAVERRLDTDSILAYLKTGLTDLNLEQVSLVENYTLIWDINHTRWLGAWESNPDGATERFGPAQQKRLEELNVLRRAIVGPLQRLSDRLCECHEPRGLAEGLYRFLIEIEADRHLRELGARLEEQGKAEEASIQYRTWDMCMTMLGQIEAMLRDCPLDLPRFRNLLERMIGTLDLGAVPQGIDEVSMGGAERMRPAQPRVVFLLGVNEGVFPASPADGGLLADADRQRLIELGVPVADRCESVVVDEKFLAYSSLCAASEKVILTCCRTSPGQEAMAPSELIRQVRHILPRCQVREESDYLLYSDDVRGLEPVEAPLPAVEYAARLWRVPSSVSASLRQALKEEPALSQAVRAIEQTADALPQRLSPDTAQTLYGEEMRLTASGVEDYHRCRFYYFCKHGLKLRPLRTAGLDVSRRGILVHYVLEQLLTSYGSKGLSNLTAEQRRGEIHRLVVDYVTRVMGGFEDKSPRFRFLIGRVEVLLDTLVEHLARELAQSQFVTAACELRVEDSPEAVRPIRIPLSSGGGIQVGGVIDRLDLYRKDDVTYFRVVDYKTGSQSYCLEDVCEGLGLQMLLYLYAVEENGEAKFGPHLRPAGVLYMPAKRMSAAADGLDEGDAEAILDKKLRMNGILLNEEESLRAMEPEGKGIFIPAVYTASGKLDARYSSVAALAFFGRLRRRIDELLGAMGESLHQGLVAPDPLDGMGSKACKYCDFGAVCPLDANAPHRQVKKLSAADKKSIYEGGGFDAIYADRETTSGD